MLNGYMDSQRSFGGSWMGICSVRFLSNVPEWPEGYSEVFQRWLNAYRDRLVSFRGGGWDALWIV